MRRYFAIVLLALLPLQFSWAAVASYCGHETQADAGHFGHHAHEHHNGAALDAGADEGAQGEKAAGAVDVDCGQCHGGSGVVLDLPAALPALLAAAPPRAALEGARGAHASARPERPQWRCLA